MEYVRVYKENGELDEERTMLENSRIDREFRSIDRLGRYLEEMKELKPAPRGTCADCKHRDNYGICTKIRDIFGYELIVENECIFSDNFKFTEVE